MEARASASTGEYAVHARIVEARASVSTGEYAVYARIVEVRASVSMGEYAVYARIVEAGASVCMEMSVEDARNVVSAQFAYVIETVMGSVSLGAVVGQESGMRQKRKKREFG